MSKVRWGLRKSSVTGDVLRTVNIVVQAYDQEKTPILITGDTSVAPPNYIVLAITEDLLNDGCILISGAVTKRGVPRAVSYLSLEESVVGILRVLEREHGFKQKSRVIKKELASPEAVHEAAVALKTAFITGKTDKLRQGIRQLVTDMRSLKADGKQVRGHVEGAKVELTQMQKALEVLQKADTAAPKSFTALAKTTDGVIKKQERQLAAMKENWKDTRTAYKRQHTKLQKTAALNQIGDEDFRRDYGLLQRFFEQGIIEAVATTKTSVAVTFGPIVLEVAKGHNSHARDKTKIYLGRVRVNFHASCFVGTGCTHVAFEGLSYAAGTWYHPHIQGPECRNICFGNTQKDFNDMISGGKIYECAMFAYKFLKTINVGDELVGIDSMNHMLMEDYDGKKRTPKAADFPADWGVPKATRKRAAAKQ